jgi:hypothetical protein
MALNSLHWALAFFWVGLGEHRTVSNVPELPELSHEVWQESFFDRCCHNSWEWDMTLGMQDTGLDVNRAHGIVSSVEWHASMMAWWWLLKRKGWWWWKTMNRVAEWNVISPNVGEDGVHNKDGGCQIEIRGTKIYKNIKLWRWGSNSKKGYVDWYIKKVRLADLDLGPVVLCILI